MKDFSHVGHCFVLPADLFLACKVLLQFGQGNENVAGSSGGTASMNVKPLIFPAGAVLPFSVSTMVSGVISPALASPLSCPPVMLTRSPFSFV